MRKRRGFVRLAILHLLQEEPMHGYQMMKELEERSDGLYQASAGTVYPALQELLDEELVVLLEIEKDKKTYSINRNGEERLREFVEKEGLNFWLEWKQRLIWRNSDESVDLKRAINDWDNALKKTIRYIRTNPSKTPELVAVLEETTERLMKIDR
jgi:DNA-binding PadR family transcriptional regulator